MRLSVTADKSPPVHCQHYRQLLQTDVVDRLVVSSLQEGRIKRHYRLHPPRRKTCCKRQGMLFRNSHVKEPVRVILLKTVQSGSVCHGRRDRRHLTVMPGNITDHLGKYICIAVLGRSIPGGPGLYVKRPGSMKSRRIPLCRLISFSFFCQYMDEHRMVYTLCLIQRLI